MTTPVGALLLIADSAGTLDLAGDKLRVRLPANAAPELRAAIRAHKPALQALIATEGRQWVLAQAEALGGVFVFFAADESAKARLVQHGAHPEEVYTRSELAELVRAGVEPGQLLTIHLARSVFGGRVAGPRENERAR